MCFFYKQSKTAVELENRFNAKFDNQTMFKSGIYNGFQYPKNPVIANNNPEKIKFFNWGLIPFWANDDKIKQYTLNARIETIHEKPAFRNVTKNRCLVLADGFYEWQWLDLKGKNKQKFELTLPNNEAFAFAGLWSEWIDKTSGEIVFSYTILTTEANELMSEIHNNKKRMPIIVSPESEKDWLNGNSLEMQNDRLIAIAAP